MTHKKFVDAFAAEMGRSKKETRQIMDDFEIALKKIVGEEPVKVADLTFVVREVPARNGRNLVTGEKIDIPATKRLYVKPSVDFKRIIKE